MSWPNIPRSIPALAATLLVTGSGATLTRPASASAQEAILLRPEREADGVDGLIDETRQQIGRGADLVKVYGDYHWGSTTGVASKRGYSPTSSPWTDGDPSEDISALRNVVLVLKGGEMVVDGR